ncbi:MAG: chaperonin [Bacteroidetes bacterium QS_8_68_28]|nr:MAG: chaperonin [Bacteroidetes bacterium QS_8_68_28]
MSELIVVGNRVLVRLEEGEQKTESGLLVPASVAEQEKVRGGRVVRCGPGHVMPNPEYSEGEVWKENSQVRYLPLQTEAGDYAFFLQDKAVEIQYEGDDYLIVPHGAILALVRPEAEDHLEDIEGLPGDLLEE